MYPTEKDEELINDNNKKDESKEYFHLQIDKSIRKDIIKLRSYLELTTGERLSHGDTVCRAVKKWMEELRKNEEISRMFHLN